MTRLLTLVASLALCPLGAKPAAADTLPGAGNVPKVLNQSGEAAAKMGSIAASDALTCKDGAKECDPSLPERAKAVKALLDGIGKLSVTDITCMSTWCTVNRAYLSASTVIAMQQAMAANIGPLIEAGDTEAARKLLKGFLNLEAQVYLGQDMSYGRVYSNLIEASQVHGIVRAAMDMLPKRRRGWWPF